MQPDRVITGTILVAACVLFVFLFVATPGFTSQKISDTKSTPAIPTSPAVPSVSASADRDERTGPPSLYYHAEVDPVPDIRYGQAGNLTIHGTTNVPAGEILRVEFIAQTEHPSPMEYYPDLQFHATTEVTKGEDSVNTWSLEVPSQNFMKPDIFQILVVNQSGYSIGGRLMNVIL
jgi:hypothetical protein